MTRREEFNSELFDSKSNIDSVVMGRPRSVAKICDLRCRKHTFNFIYEVVTSFITFKVLVYY